MTRKKLQLELINCLGEGIYLSGAGRKGVKLIQGKGRFLLYQRSKWGNCPKMASMSVPSSQSGVGDAG